MKSVLKWLDGMKFEAQSEQNSIHMDAKPPLGQAQGMTPKELVAVGLAGCTAMDVIALLKKHKQGHKDFQVGVEVTPSTTGHPVVFDKILLTFEATGDIDPKVLLESVLLSQTKYCGVSAMLSKAVPIDYAVILNGSEIGRGQAQFH